MSFFLFLVGKPRATGGRAGVGWSSHHRITLAVRRLWKEHFFFSNFFSFSFLSESSTASRMGGRALARCPARWSIPSPLTLREPPRQLRHPAGARQVGAPPDHASSQSSRVSGEASIYCSQLQTCIPITTSYKKTGKTCLTRNPKKSVPLGRCLWKKSPMGKIPIEIQMAHATNWNCMDLMGT